MEFSKWRYIIPTLIATVLFFVGVIVIYFLDYEEGYVSVSISMVLFITNVLSLFNTKFDNKMVYIFLLVSLFSILFYCITKIDWKVYTGTGVGIVLLTLLMLYLSVKAFPNSINKK